MIIAKLIAYFKKDDIVQMAQKIIDSYARKNKMLPARKDNPRR